MPWWHSVYVACSVGWLGRMYGVQLVPFHWKFGLAPESTQRFMNGQMFAIGPLYILVSDNPEG